MATGPSAPEPLRFETIDPGATRETAGVRIAPRYSGLGAPPVQASASMPSLPGADNPPDEILEESTEHDYRAKARRSISDSNISRERDEIPPESTGTQDNLVRSLISIMEKQNEKE